MVYLESIIQANYPTMTKKEKKIADYLLTHSEEARNQTISEIAESCEVAESTVFLFSKKIGLSGFKELTVLLANNQKGKLFDGIYEEGSQQAITENIFETTVQSLRSTANLIDFEQLSGAVELLVQAKKIVFFGMGASAAIALDGYHKFLRAPIDTEFNLEYHMQLLKAGKLTEKDCAIVISHSGENPDIKRITDLLNRNNVPIIAITSFNNTPFTKAAKYVFLSTTEELKYKETNIYTRRVAQMVLIDLLFTLMMISDDTNSIPSIEQLKQALYSTK